MSRCVLVHNRAVLGLPDRSLAWWGLAGADGLRGQLRGSMVGICLVMCWAAAAESALTMLIRGLLLCVWAAQVRPLKKQSAMVHTGCA
jgi:hypothetical protein